MPKLKVLVVDVAYVQRQFILLDVHWSLYIVYIMCTWCANLERMEVFE